MKFVRPIKKIWLLVIVVLFLAAAAVVGRHFYWQQKIAEQKLWVPIAVPAAGNTEHTILLTWFWTQKRPEPPGIVDYRLYINDWEAGTYKDWHYGPEGTGKKAHCLNDDSTFPTERYQCTLTGLEDYTYYQIGIEPILASGKTLPRRVIEAGTLTAGPAISVLDYGVRGLGETDDTEMLQRIINICPPGGSVVLGKGIYYSGPLRLHGQMTFRLAAGAELRALPRETPNPAAVLPDSPAFLNGDGGYVIRIEGPGKICGAAYPWLRFKGTVNLCLQDLCLQNVTEVQIKATEKALQFLDCRELVLNGVTAIGLPQGALDLSGSRRVMAASSILP